MTLWEVFCYSSMVWVHLEADITAHQYKVILPHLLYPMIFFPKCTPTVCTPTVLFTTILKQNGGILEERKNSHLIFSFCKYTYIYTHTLT